MKKSMFTLIELLVVIAIIAILASILLPALNRARDRSKSVKCLSQVRETAAAALFYAQDSGGLIPYYTAYGDVGTWTVVLTSLNYLSRNLLVCPSDAATSASRDQRYYNTYGLWGRRNNTEKNYDIVGGASSYLIAGSNEYHVTHRMKNLTRYPLFADTSKVFGHVYAGSRAWCYGIRALYDQSAILPAHLSHANLAFADGHAAPQDPNSMATMGILVSANPLSYAAIIKTE